MDIESRWVCAHCGYHLAKVALGAGSSVTVRIKCRRCGAYNTFVVRHDDPFPHYEKRGMIRTG